MRKEVRLYEKEDESWDEIIYSFPGYNAYQSEDWRKQKSSQGWEVQRLMVVNDGEIVGCAQMQIKHLPLRGAIVWIPGGILGQFSVRDLKMGLSQLNLKYYVVRASFNYFIDGYENCLDELGWKKAPVLANNCQSMILDTNKDVEVLKSELSGSWRHNLKRSEKKEVQIIESDSFDAKWLRDLYAEMEERKNLGVQFSVQELNAIAKNMKDKIKFFTATDVDQNILAIRSYIHLKGKAWDLFAITTPKGRKCYASHALLWKCICDCADKKIKYFDLSGIDPVNNKGTYNFKKGTGAKEITFHKDREYSNVPLLRFLFNLFIKIRFR